MTPGDRVLGDAPFELTGSTDSGLDVTFEPLSANIAISGTKVTLLGAGIAHIKAIQNGNDLYAPAEPIEISFCVNPPTPSIVASNAITNTVLTSSNSSGNQWYRNNEAIDGAIGTVLSTDESGTYTVITTSEGCSSLESDSYELFITGIGIDPVFSVEVFPNPATEVIHVQLNGYDARNVTIKLLDTFGRVVATKQAQDRKVTLDAANYTTGLYILKVISGNSIVTQKIVKE